MKIIVTGSLGYISKPLTQQLIKKGHSVTVISSQPERRADIESLGAQAAIGKMDDAEFLTNTFSGADAVYCMLAPYGNLADPNNSAAMIIQRADAIAISYLKALTNCGIKRVVYLSSIGADMSADNGLILVHHHAERTLSKLPADVNLSIIRPAGFYKNLFAFIYAVKYHNTISASYGDNDVVIWVSGKDIADAITQELESQQAGKKVRYVASEELSCTKSARIIGSAIGKPELKWTTISNEQQLHAFKEHGMSDSIAAAFVEMNASIHNGKFYNDYYRNRPALGKVKMKDFAEEFAAAYRRE